MSLRRVLLAALYLFAVIIVCGQNVSGTVTCNGRGVRGVAVSDGDVVVVTDRQGRYSMQSDKRNGYVFYTLPRGYEPELADGFNPLFWQRLVSPSPSVSEQHDFRLQRADNDHFRILIGADTHLANRASDLEQFRRLFIPCLQKERERAGRRPVYSMLLGDLTWDVYWTKNRFNLQDFLRTCREMGYSLPLFPVIGNHDNDPSVPASPQTDFLSSAPWRDIICPNYYSYNLGRVHFVVLDDIYYQNEDTGGKYQPGVVGSRNYKGVITEEQFRWLEQDLALVSDVRTPIIVALHIPTMKLNHEDYSSHYRLADASSERLFEMLRRFKTVHVVSGHTHYNFCAHPEAYPNVMEHNIAAVCAAWWNTGNATGRHLCTDGSPGGYSLWTIDGRRIRWQYHSMEQDDCLQMRLIDMNAVRDYYRNYAPVRQFLKKYPQRTDFAQIDDNMVYLNVFAYDSDWKVELFEDGKPLAAQRQFVEDPLRLLAYDMPSYLAKGSAGTGSQGKRNTHMFVARAASAVSTIRARVTDSFGQVYTQELCRPGPYDLNIP